MKQVYLMPQSATRAPLRSDTLFGLLTWGVREVYGPGAVDRFLAPLRRDPPQAPLVVTSAFPFADRPEGRVHWFPRPRVLPGPGEWIEDRALLAFISGMPVPAEESAPEPIAPGRGGLFFLAAGPAEHYVEAAAGYLARTGFGGGGSTGGSAYDVEVREAEFLRLAHPGEEALLLSLWFPTDGERRALREACGRAGVRVSYGVTRRRGVVGGRLLRPERPFKRPVLMVEEGAVLPYPAQGGSAGASPIVAEVADGAGRFPVLQHGFGFFVPVRGAAP